MYVTIICLNLFLSSHFLKFPFLRRKIQASPKACAEPKQKMIEKNWHPNLTLLMEMNLVWYPGNLGPLQH